MAFPAQLAVPIGLLAVFVFCVLLIAYRVLQRLRFYLAMRALAHELTFHYTQPIIFNPPTVNGFFQGREVLVDTVGESTRVRVFHRGNVDSDFTVADARYFSAKGKTEGVMRYDCEIPEFSERFRVIGGDMSNVRKYLDQELQGRILECCIPFTVGRYDVSYVEGGYPKDTKRLRAAVDFLVDAAVKADHI